MSRPLAREAPAPDRIRPDERAAAAPVLGAAFMLLADTSIVNLAVPSVQRELKASVPDVQLMVPGVALLGLAFFPGFTGDPPSLGYPTLQNNLTYALVVVTAAFVLASLLVTVIAGRSRVARDVR